MVFSKFHSIPPESLLWRLCGWFLLLGLWGSLLNILLEKQGIGLGVVTQGLGFLERTCPKLHNEGS